MINLGRINRFFENAATLIIRFRWLGILLFLLVLGVSFTGLGKIRMDASMENWFLDNDPMKIAEDEFKEIFGNNEYVAVMVESDDIFTPAVLEKIRELGHELKDKVPFSDEILSITDCEFTIGNDEGMEIIDLVPDPVPDSPEAMEKIRTLALSKPLFVNKIISDDSRQSWIIIRLKNFPEHWRSENNEGPDFVVGKTAGDIINQDKYRILNPKGAGLPILGADKMKFFKKEMGRTMMLSLVATVIVLILAIRTLRGVLIPMMTAFGSVVIIFGMQGHLGTLIDPSLILVPVYLGLAVAIGYSIHIFSFFNREFRKTGKRKESVVFAVKESGWPIFFTALTTIGALASFAFIDVKTIRWVGITAASLVAVTFFIVIIITPSLLCLGKDGNPRKEKKAGFTHAENFLVKTGRTVLAWPRTIMACFIIITIVCAAGLAKFEVSFDIRKTFGLKIPYVARLNYVANSSVGSLYSYNLTVAFNEDGAAKNPENLEKFDDLMKKAQRMRLTKKTSSLVEIIKDMNQVLNGGDPSFYRIPETRQMIAQLLLLYENAGGAEAEKWVDYDYSRLRMMIEMGDYNSLEAKRELMQLREAAEQMFPDAQVGLAGSVAQFTIMQNIVSNGQLISFGIAMVVITILMMVVFGSVKTGLIAMIPNIMPAIATGGIMGWADIPLDMMTITIMPMLLGLAVDDTIHFINHAHLEFERTGSYEESIQRTFSTIGVAILMTSVIITANFSVYVTSIAKVYVNLGILTGIGIMTALLTDYLITPILITWVKPFGMEQEPSPAKTEKTTAESDPCETLIGCTTEPA